MATKKDKSKDPAFDDLKLDDDLWSDLDTKDLGFDGDFDNPGGEDAETNRSPITKHITSVGKSLSTAGAAAVGGAAIGISQKIKQQFPDASNAADLALRSAGDIVRMKNDILKELRPTINESKLALRQVLQLGDSMLPSVGLFKKLDKMLETAAEEGEKSETKAPSKDELREQSMQTELGKMFAIQAKESLLTRKKDEAERIIDKREIKANHVELTAILSDVRTQSMFQTTFLRTSTTAYMKKSLELQYRHLFVAQDTLEALKLTTKSMEERLDAIKHNTALPDSQKIFLFERSRSMLKEKMASSMSDHISNFTTNVRKKLMDDYVRPAIDNAQTILEQLTMGMDMFKEAREMGGDEFSAKNMALGATGGFFGKIVGGRAARSLIRKLPPEVRDTINRMGRLGPTEAMLFLERLRRGEQEWADGKDRDWLEQIAQLFPALQRKYGLHTNVGYAQGKEAGVITNKFIRTVEEIIPAYLAMQTKYLEQLVTGKPAEEKIYDWKKAKFITRTQFNKQAETMVFGSAERRRDMQRVMIRNIREAASDVNLTVPEEGGGYTDEEYAVQNEQYRKQLDYNIKGISTDLSQALMNMGYEGNTQQIRIEKIREVAEGKDYSRDPYSRVFFKNIPKPREFANKLLSVIQDPNGKPNQGVIKAMEEQIHNYYLEVESRRSNFEKVIDQGNLHFLDMATTDSSGNITMQERMRGMDARLTTSQIYEKGNVSNFRWGYEEEDPLEKLKKLKEGFFGVFKDLEFGEKAKDFLEEMTLKAWTKLGGTKESYEDIITVARNIRLAASGRTTELIKTLKEKAKIPGEMVLAYINDKMRENEKLDALRALIFSEDGTLRAEDATADEITHALLVINADDFVMKIIEGENTFFWALRTTLYQFPVWRGVLDSFAQNKRKDREEERKKLLAAKPTFKDRIAGARKNIVTVGDTDFTRDKNTGQFVVKDMKELMAFIRQRPDLIPGKDIDVSAILNKTQLTEIREKIAPLSDEERQRYTALSQVDTRTNQFSKTGSVTPYTLEQIVGFRLDRIITLLGGGKDMLGPMPSDVTIENAKRKLQEDAQGYTTKLVATKPNEGRNIEDMLREQMGESKYRRYLKNRDTFKGALTNAWRESEADAITRLKKLKKSLTPTDTDIGVVKAIRRRAKKLGLDPNEISKLYDPSVITDPRLRAKYEELVNLLSKQRDNAAPTPEEKAIVNSIRRHNRKVQKVNDALNKRASVSTSTPTGEQPPEANKKARGGTIDAFTGQDAGTYDEPSLIANGNALVGEHGRETVVPHNKTNDAIRAYLEAKAYHEGKTYAEGGTVDEEGEKKKSSITDRAIARFKKLFGIERLDELQQNSGVVTDTVIGRRFVETSKDVLRDIRDLTSFIAVHLAGDPNAVAEYLGESRRTRGSVVGAAAKTGWNVVKKGFGKIRDTERKVRHGAFGLAKTAFNKAGDLAGSAKDWLMSQEIPEIIPDTFKRAGEAAYDLAATPFRSMAAMITPFIDVYRSDQMDKPLVYAAEFSSGMVVYDDGSPIKSSWTIDRPVKLNRDHPLNKKRFRRKNSPDIYVIKPEDLAAGLCTRRGAALNSFGHNLGKIIRNAGSFAANSISNLAGTLGTGMKWLADFSIDKGKELLKKGLEKKNPFIDVYNSDDMSKPVLYGEKIKSGQYVYNDGKPVTSAYGIKGQVRDRETGNILIEEEDIEKLVDINTNKLTAWRGRSFLGKLATAGFELGKWGLRKGMALGKKAWNFLKGKFNFGMFSADDIKDYLSTKLNGLFDSLKEMRPMSRKDLEEVVGTRMDKMLLIMEHQDAMFARAFKVPPAVNGDTDGDNIRDNSYRDQQQDKEAKRRAKAGQLLALPPGTGDSAKVVAAIESLKNEVKAQGDDGGGLLGGLADIMGLGDVFDSVKNSRIGRWLANSKLGRLIGGATGAIGAKAAAAKAAVGGAIASGAGKLWTGVKSGAGKVLRGGLKGALKLAGRALGTVGGGLLRGAGMMIPGIGQVLAVGTAAYIGYKLFFEKTPAKTFKKVRQNLYGVTEDQWDVAQELEETTIDIIAQTREPLTDDEINAYAVKFGFVDDKKLASALPEDLKDTIASYREYFKIWYTRRFIKVVETCYTNIGHALQKEPGEKFSFDIIEELPDEQSQVNLIKSIIDQVKGYINSAYAFDGVSPADNMPVAALLPTHDAYASYINKMENLRARKAGENYDEKNKDGVSPIKYDKAESTYFYMYNGKRVEDEDKVALTTKWLQDKDKYRKENNLDNAIAKGKVLTSKDVKKLERQISMKVTQGSSTLEVTRTETLSAGPSAIQEAAKKVQAGEDITEAKVSLGSVVGKIAAAVLPGGMVARWAISHAKSFGYQKCKMYGIRDGKLDSIAKWEDILIAHFQDKRDFPTDDEIKSCADDLDFGDGFLSIFASKEAKAARQEYFKMWFTKRFVPIAKMIYDTVVKIFNKKPNDEISLDEISKIGDPTLKEQVINELAKRADAYMTGMVDSQGSLSTIKISELRPDSETYAKFKDKRDAAAIMDELKLDKFTPSPVIGDDDGTYYFYFNGQKIRCTTKVVAERLREAYITQGRLARKAEEALGGNNTAKALDVNDVEKIEKQIAQQEQREKAKQEADIKAAEKQVAKEKATTATPAPKPVTPNKTNATTATTGAPASGVSTAPVTSPVSGGPNSTSAMANNKLASLFANAAQGTVGGGTTGQQAPPVDMSKIPASATPPKGDVNELGSFVSKYESGGKGSAAIGYDSAGGTSYGTYQLSSRRGSLKEFVAWCQSTAPEVYQELAPYLAQADTGSTRGDFVNRWLSLVQRGKINYKLEHQYYVSKFFNPALKRLEKLNPEAAKMVQGSRALQEAYWSTAVQHGAYGTKFGAPGIFHRTFKPGIDTATYLRNIYADRSMRFKDPKVLNGVRRRFRNELGDMLALDKQYGNQTANAFVSPEGATAGAMAGAEIGASAATSSGVSTDTGSGAMPTASGADTSASSGAGASGGSVSATVSSMQAGLTAAMGGSGPAGASLGGSTTGGGPGLSMPTDTGSAGSMGTAGAAGGGIVTDAGGSAKASKAADIATSRAHNRSTGYCARYVKNALLSAGYKFTPRGSAYQYATENVLPGMGFTEISANSQPMKGDVAVIGSNARHVHGHIQIWNGRTWISDFVQNPSKKGPYKGAAGIEPGQFFRLYRDLNGAGTNVPAEQQNADASVQETKVDTQAVAASGGDSQTGMSSLGMPSGGPNVDISGTAMTTSGGTGEASSGVNTFAGQTNDMSGGTGGAPGVSTATPSQTGNVNGAMQNNAQLQELKMISSILSNIRTDMQSYFGDSKSETTVPRAGENTAKPSTGSTQTGIGSNVETLKQALTEALMAIVQQTGFTGASASNTPTSSGGYSSSAPAPRSPIDMNKRAPVMM